MPFISHPIPEIFKNCAAIPQNVIGVLGNEDGYWRLPGHAIIQEGDETYGAMTNTWETANASQIGRIAKEVGGFFIWRRKL